MRFKRHFSIWTIIKAIDQISKWTGLTFAWLAVPLAVILIWEVFARKLFSPTFWAFDLSYMVYGGHFMLVAAYTLYRGKHIRTDFFYRLWSPRWQGLVDAILYLFLFLPGMSIFLWLSWEFAYESLLFKERYMLSPWMPPIYPLKLVIPVATGLLVLQGISEFLKSLYAALRGRW